MSRSVGVWHALGIEPTSDTRAIRTAYARKLKTIDPDRDPQAFIALRQAFEGAQQAAQWIDREDQWEDPEWDEEADEPAIEIASQMPPAVETRDEILEQPARPEPWRPIAPADADFHARALMRKLHELHEAADPALEAAAEREILDHWNAMIGDPRMQEVAFYADAERWFADLIARTLPWSDALVAPASDYFGWMAAADTISQSPAAAYIVQRRRSIAFFEAVRKPGHPSNAACAN